MLVISHCLLLGSLILTLLLVLLVLLSDDTECDNFMCDPPAAAADVDPDPWGMFSLTCFDSCAVSVREAPNISLKLS